MRGKGRECVELFPPRGKHTPTQEEKEREEKREKTACCLHWSRHAVLFVLLSLKSGTH